MPSDSGTGRLLCVEVTGIAARPAPPRKKIAPETGVDPVARATSSNERRSIPCQLLDSDRVHAQIEGIQVFSGSGTSRPWVNIDIASNMSALTILLVSAVIAATVACRPFSFRG